MGELTTAGGPIGWGIIGCGAIADGFASDLRLLPEARLVAVASRREERAQHFAARHGALRCHARVEDLVNDPAVDVVYIATPNHRHLPDSLLCLSNGKPVLCEKPFAMNAAEVRSIADEARARSLFCMEAMWMRFIPTVREAVDLIRRGTIGEIRTVHADFSLNVAFDPTSRLFDPLMGGGALLDLGVYTVSLADLLLGPPVHVEATSALAPTGVDVSTAALLGHANGQAALISVSLGSVGPNEAVIAGDAGTIRLHGPICVPPAFDVTERRATAALRPGGLPIGRIHRFVRASPALTRAARATRSLAARDTRRHKAEMLGKGFAHEALEVMRCLREGLLESPLMTLDESVRVAGTVDAIRTAADAAT
jgi:predicted dehydrogenase